VPRLRISEAVTPLPHVPSWHGKGPFYVSELSLSEVSDHYFRQDTKCLASVFHDLLAQKT
jgi:hypothetical protein